MNSVALDLRQRVLARLRYATGEAHRRLDERLDAVARLASPSTRSVLLRRYAAFHIPADSALARLHELPGLEMPKRSRTPLLVKFAAGPMPVFPQPRNRSEALGMLYVIEGSTLGGRLILRELEKLGINDPDLGFLDPYGSETGAMWRAAIAVLDGEIGGEDAGLAACCDGAVAAFSHAERVLCDGVGV